MYVLRHSLIPFRRIRYSVTSTFASFQEGLVDSGDEFMDFRSRVTELIKDVVFIVGSSTVMRQVQFCFLGYSITDLDNIM